MANYQPPAPAPGSAFNSFAWTGNSGQRDPGGAALQTVDPATMTVGGQLNGLLAANNPYIELARAQGTQQAASRGMLNSSMAAGSAQNAAIAAALPIATGNAQEYAGVSAANQQAQNQLVGENLAYQGQVDAAGASASASEFAAQLNYNAAMANQKQQFQEYGMGLGFQYAQLGQQGTQFSQQLEQQGQQFQQNLGQNWNMFQQGQNTQIGQFQTQMQWNQYALGMSLNSQSQNEYAQTFAAIMQNPNMTAADRSAALGNAQQFYSQMSQYNSTIPAFTPAWSIDPNYWASAWTGGSP